MKLRDVAPFTVSRVRAHRLVLVVSAFAAAACVNGTLPRRSAQHPGNPSAPEGYAPAPVGVLGEEPRPEIASASNEQVIVNVCPMHPDVTSSTPGTCPKCGMKLVPRPIPSKPSPSTTP